MRRRTERRTNMAKVFLSAGHGGSDPGAVGYGMKEKDINLQVVLACRDVLEYHGVNVVCSRARDENDPVAQEVTEANASGAEIAVSFHTNAGEGDGSESFYWAGDSDGIRLARLCEKYTQELGQNSRGVKSGNHLWFVKATKMTAVLCEIGFIDHDTDNDIFDTLAEQKAFGVAYARAILEYLGIPYKGDVPAPVLPEILTNPSTNISTAKAGDVVYQVYAAGRWWNYITNWGAGSEGYAGVFGNAMRALRAYVKGKAEEVGYLEYRTHRLGGDWYNWQRDREYDQNGENFAGDLLNRFDGLQMQLVGAPGKHVRYRVHAIDIGWLDWITDYGEGDNGYAGLWGYAIDGVQIEIV